MSRILYSLAGGLACLLALAATADELESLLEGEPEVRELQRAAVRLIDCDPDSARRLEQDVRALRPMPDARARLLKEQRARNDRREEVLRRVTDLYYERQRARIRLDREPDLSDDERVALLLAAEESAAHLDALTGGEFSRLLARVREEDARARVGQWTPEGGRDWVWVVED